MMYGNCSVVSLAFDYNVGHNGDNESKKDLLVSWSWKHLIAGENKTQAHDQDSMCSLIMTPPVTHTYYVSQLSHTSFTKDE
jgi:hypothetical protein